MAKGDTIKVESLDQTRMLAELIQHKTDNVLGAYSMMRQAGVPLGHTIMTMARKDCRDALTLFSEVQILLHTQHMSGECTNAHCTDSTDRMMDVYQSNQDKIIGLLAELDSDAIKAPIENSELPAAQLADMVNSFLESGQENDSTLLGFYL